MESDLNIDLGMNVEIATDRLNRWSTITEGERKDLIDWIINHGTHGLLLSILRLMEEERENR